jgi:predicted Zn-dependent protease
MSLQQLSMLAQMTKNISLGVSYFERAIALFPQYALTHAQYGLFLVSTNNVDAGIEHLKQSVAMEPKLAAGYAGLAHAYVKKGDMTKAREAADKARELGFTGQLPAGL